MSSSEYSVYGPDEEIPGSSHLVTLILLIDSLTKVDETITKHVNRDPLIAGLLQFRQTLTTQSDETKDWFDIPASDEANLELISPNQEPRLMFGKCLTIVYNKLAKYLRSIRSKVNDEYILLSVNQLKTVSASLQFYVVAQCLPFLDEGVGVDIRKRSKFIKMWARMNKNPGIKLEQLLVAFRTMRGLMECNQAVAAEIMKYHLQDVLAVYEQMVHVSLEQGRELGDKEDTFSSVPNTVLLPTIIGMLKAAPPPWLSAALGKRLTTQLLREGGLRSILNAYADLCDDFWDRAPVLSLIARQLATPPSSHPPSVYYTNIMEQFIFLSTVRYYPQAGLSCLLSSFVEELYVRSPETCKVYVLDRLFSPWESIIQEKKASFLLEKIHLTAIHTIAFLTDHKIMPRPLIESGRVPDLFVVLLDIVASKIDNPVKDIIKIRDHAVKILLATIDRIVNKGEFVMRVMRDNCNSVYKLTSKSKKKWVEVVKKNAINMDLDEDCPVMIEHLSSADEEKLLVQRLDALFSLPDPDRMAHINIEIFCEFMESWMKTDDITPQERSADEDMPKITFDNLTSRVFGIYFFDRLVVDMDATNPQVMRSIIKFVTTTLKCCIRTINQLEDHQKKFDVVRKDVLSAVTDRAALYQLRIDSSKVALNLASAIVTAEALNDQISEDVILLAKQLLEFQKLDTKNTELRKLMKQASELVTIIEVARGGKPIDSEEQPDEPLPPKPEEPKDIQSLMNTLTTIDLNCPDAIAILGHSLLSLTQGIRNRNKKYLEAIDQWILNVAKQFVTHEDTYVFLNAINTLAEIANYAPKYLTHMLELVKSKPKDTELSPEVYERSIILRVNVGEAVSKVFKVMGDAAVLYVDESAAVFLDEMVKGPDLSRASAFTAFSAIILACKGRNIAKFFPQINAAVIQGMSTTEPEIIRRSAIFLTRQYIKSCSSELIDICGNYLRDIRRHLVRVWESDADYVMRIHSQICIEEMQACLNSNVEGSLNVNIRKINI